MEQSAGGRSASTHSGKKAGQTEGNGFVAETSRKKARQIEGSRLVAESTQLQDVTVSNKHAPRKGSKPVKPLIEKIEEVDQEIARLKRPPTSMTREDFKRRFLKLASEGENPHRFRKGRVSSSCLQEIFGDPYGEGGRQGYGWVHCKHPDVVARVQYLHPIVYQHTVSEIPLYLMVHFAEGVAAEFNEGKGKVDWCAFGAETNKRQVNRYDQALRKLHALRNAGRG